MFSATIVLHWPDGGSASAALQAESAEADCPVTYIGDVARLVGAPAESDFPLLKFILQRIAADTGATCFIETSGQYDRWAGGAKGL
jgi:hypothetical protein